MGFSFRKSFRIGRARLNLSKSGLGISTGTKGATIGTGTRGAYLSAGFKGLFYRKRLGAGNGSSGGTPEISTLAAVVIFVGVLIVAAVIVAMVGFLAWAVS